MDALTHWQIVFPTTAPCWHAPWLMLIIPWTLLFLMSSKVFLLVMKLLVVACLIPASFISKSTNLIWLKHCVWHHLVHLQKKICILREIWPNPSQYKVFCLTYRKQDWLGINSTLNCTSGERFSITPCWISLASALQMAKWATAYD